MPASPERRPISEEEMQNPAEAQPQAPEAPKLVSVPPETARVNGPEARDLPQLHELSLTLAKQTLDRLLNKDLPEALVPALSRETYTEEARDRIADIYKGIRETQDLIAKTEAAIQIAWEEAEESTRRNDAEDRAWLDAEYKGRLEYADIKFELDNASKRVDSTKKAFDIAEDYLQRLDINPLKPGLAVRIPGKKRTAYVEYNRALADYNDAVEEAALVKLYFTKPEVHNALMDAKMERTEIAAKAMTART